MLNADQPLHARPPRHLPQPLHGGLGLAGGHGGAVLGQAQGLGGDLVAREGVAGIALGIIDAALLRAALY